MTFARMVRIHSTPDQRSAIEKLADNAYAISKDHPGFVSATYMINDAETEYASLTLWDSRENAEAAGAAIREKHGEVMMQVSASPPDIEVFEIYQAAGSA